MPFAATLESAESGGPDDPHPDLLRDIFRQALAPMWVMDTAGLICHVNPALEASTGYSAAELLGQPSSVMTAHLPSGSFCRNLATHLRNERRWQGEIWSHRRSGEVVREWLSVTALTNRGGDITHYLGTYAGMPQHRQADDADAVQGGIDNVTGVLNRAGFLAEADRLHNTHGNLAVITLDIDGFTDVNEQFGLHVGDTLLRQLAMRCLQAMASQGGVSVLGRVGGDEFALAWTLNHASVDGAPDRAHRVAEALRVATCGHYEAEAGRLLPVSVSVGVAMLSGATQPAAEGLLHASAARLAPSLARGEVHHYEQLDQHRRLVRALRADLLADRIEVAFQPKVHLPSGRLTGLEALARWTGPDGEAVPPATFIMLAERHGLIADLGDRVLEKVLRHLASWRHAGLPVVPVAVNFSAAQFRRADMAARVEAALARHGLPAQLIEIELTESILLHDFDAALLALGALRAIGVRLSIDDFGTGYSSLAYLRRFPVNCLKVDRSFVADVVSDVRTLEIVDTVVTLAHKFDMCCIAEGVETREQMAALQALGCDQAQGYLFAKPLSPADLRQMLVTNRPWDVGAAATWD
jgi:diguanylate cyclase (GGDEF)-like protein/PAS domain S-box-containing protein